MIQLDRHDSGKLDRARAIVRDLDSVLVAFSGGVDSTLLLKLALDELGDRAVAVLASSPAYPESEQDEARAMARSLGARLVEVDTHELELEAYTRNNPDRCFHCKEELFETLEPIRVELGLQHLAYGATADDAGDHRPGHGSAVRRGVRFPRGRAPAWARQLEQGVVRVPVVTHPARHRGHDPRAETDRGGRARDQAAGTAAGARARSRRCGANRGRAARDVAAACESRARGAGPAGRGVQVRFPRPGGLLDRKPQQNLEAGRSQVA